MDSLACPRPVRLRAPPATASPASRPEQAGSPPLSNIPLGPDEPHSPARATRGPLQPAGNVPPAAPSHFAVSPLSPTAPKRTLSAPPLFSSCSSTSAFLSAQDRSLTEEDAAGAGEADEDPAISELLEIFSHPGALLVPSPTASTPRAASSSSRSTILLAPGPAAVGAVAGVRTPSRIGAHARRRSSAGSAGTAAADAAGGGGVDYVAAARAARRTPPFGPGFGGGAWEGLPHSPPSRALTRNPFPRHAHSAYPVLQLAPSAVSPTIHSTNKAQGQQPAQVEPSRESSGLGAPRGPAALAASTAQASKFTAHVGPHLSLPLARPLDLNSHRALIPAIPPPYLLLHRSPDRRRARNAARAGARTPHRAGRRAGAARAQGERAAARGGHPDGVGVERLVGQPARCCVLVLALVVFLFPCLSPFSCSLDPSSASTACI